MSFRHPPPPAFRPPLSQTVDADAPEADEHWALPAYQREALEQNTETETASGYPARHIILHAERPVLCDSTGVCTKSAGERHDALPIQKASDPQTSFPAATTLVQKAPRRARQSGVRHHVGKLLRRLDLEQPLTVDKLREQGY